MIRSIYHSKSELLVRYGIIFWGAGNESIPIFKLQKRVIQSMCGAGTGTFCRQLFKDCKILMVTSLYVFEVLRLLRKYKSTVPKKKKRKNRYMIVIQGQILIYVSNHVIQISIKK
jgi:hypothetical protein